jgi:hypothetical protein
MQAPPLAPESRPEAGNQCLVRLTFRAVKVAVRQPFANIGHGRRPGPK